MSDSDIQGRNATLLPGAFARKHGYGIVRSS